MRGILTVSIMGFTANLTGENCLCFVSCQHSDPDEPWVRSFYPGPFRPLVDDRQARPAPIWGSGVLTGIVTTKSWGAGEAFVGFVDGVNTNGVPWPCLCIKK